MTKYVRGFAIGVLMFAPALPVLAQSSPAPPTKDDCLACHGDPAATRADGRPVAVDAKAFAASVHGPLECVNCHEDLASAKEFPHAEKLKAVKCATCHDEPVKKYQVGAHAQSRARGGMLAATCVDCHGMHDIRSSSDSASRTYHLNLPNTCGRCHGDSRVISQAKIEIGNVYSVYQDSIHGKAIRKSGLMVAPNCGDCHGSHDVKRRTDGTSSVNRVNVPATCGKCHEGISAQYRASIHGQVLAAGNVKAATCIDCHTAHGVQRADNERWQLGVIAECGTCHAQSIRTYRDTFHGQVTNLGFRRVAACADCHGSHGIFKKDDPRSTVAAGRRVATCQKCHAGATTSFVRYAPHADKHDRASSPTLYFASRFMTVLLWAVFIFFGIHTALWFARAVAARRPVLVRSSGPRRGGDRGGAA